MEKSISKSKIRKHLPGLLILALGALLFSGCSKNDNNLSPQEPAKSVNDIPTVLENISSQDSLKEDVSVSKHYSSRHHRKSFRTLLTALVKTNLLGTVANNKLTLFAPTDEAFAEIGLNPRNIGSVPNLKEILLYHVISGQVYSSSLSSKFFPTLNGAALDVKVDGDDIMINDANVIRADIWAFNGVIHVIDKVLLPPTKNLVELALSFDPEFSILVKAVEKAGLVETLSTGGPFTIFAPTNAAFVSLLAELGASSLDDIDAATLKNVLLYHAVNGRVYSSDLASGPVTTLNGSFFVNVPSLTVTDSKSRVANLVPSSLNIQATNGVIHVIDKVLLPPTKNLVELALSYAPEFSILVKAVEKAGLAETLSTGGPFTIFAPTNAAFVSLLAELGKNSLDDIDAATLKNVLLYHAVNGRVYSSDLVSGTVTTLNGSFLVNVPLLTITDSKSRVANLVPSLLDIQATNGVIHVIDKVLLP